MRIAAFCASFVLLAAVCSAAPVRVEVLPKAEVDSGVIRLGDFTKISTQDPDLTSYLEDLTVMSSPGPTQSVRLGREFVAVVLARVGLSRLDWEINGAATAEIGRPGRVLPSEEILSAIKDYLLEKEKLDPKDFNIETEGRVQSVTLPDGPYDLEVKRVSERLGGSTRFEITVLQKNLANRTFPICVSVACYQILPTARRSISRGERISETDVEPARLDVSRMSSRELARLMKTTEGITGKEARVDVPAGRPILSDMLSIPNVIRSGDRVTLVVTCGRVRISAPGVAQQDGQVGDTIRVMNSATRKKTYGRVVGSGVVKLQ